MNSRSSHLKLEPAHKHELTVSKVMLVYEDTDAGVRAKLALKRLPRELKLANGCSITFWRQDLLSLPWLREQAALEACDAELILIAIGEKENTPNEIKDWLNRWLHHKRSVPCALSVLSTKDSLETASKTIGYIKCIADYANAVFFCGIEELSQVERTLDSPCLQHVGFTVASVTRGEESIEL